MGGMNTFATAVEDQAVKGFRRMNPFCIPFAITNMPGARVSEKKDGAGGVFFFSSV